MSPVAPSACAKGLEKTKPTTAKIKPITNVKTMSMPKYLFARGRSPSPCVVAMIALPPVPTMKPAELRIMINGMMKFTAAKAVSPAKLETKKPSTMP